MSPEGLFSSVHCEGYEVRPHTHCHQLLMRNIEDLDLVGFVASYRQQGITILGL